MYGKVHGKQLKDGSVDLLKLDLSGSQGAFLFATGSYLGAYEVPNIPQAFITKQYADSLSSGLDPKESVVVVSTSNITLSGIQSIDGYTISVSDRILVTGQASPVDNGIYIASTVSWVRSSDSDGDPGNEVSLGNYTFVEKGSTFSSTGWVLYSTNAPGSTVSVGVDTQLWTQFNSATVHIWGDGLANLGNNVFVDINPNSGLTFSAGQLTLASYLAGGGLTLTSGIFAVGAGTGITVNADDIAVHFTTAASTLAGAGLANNGTAIDIAVGAGNDSSFIVNANDVVLNRNILADNLTALGTASSLTASSGNLQVMVDNSTITRNSNGQLVANITSAENLAGAGLTSSGIVLNIGAGSGISVNPDSIAINYTQLNEAVAGAGLTSSGIVLNIGAGSGIIVNADSIQADYAAQSAEQAGAGLTSSGNVINVGAGAGITVNADTVAVDYSAVATQLAGAGLAPNGTTIDISLVKGVTFSGDGLFSDASTINTTNQLVTVNIATNSSIQSALSAIDSFLTNVGTQEEISMLNSPTCIFIKSINAPQNVLGYTFSTASDGAPHIYINGLYVKTNSTTASSPAYFSTDGGITGNTNVITNSVLYLNPFVLDYKLDPTDDIVVHYLTKT